MSVILLSSVYSVPTSQVACLGWGQFHSVCLSGDGHRGQEEKARFPDPPAFPRGQGPRPGCLSVPAEGALPWRNPSFRTRVRAASLVSVSRHVQSGSVGPAAYRNCLEPRPPSA